VRADTHIEAYEKYLELAKAQHEGTQQKVLGVKACASLFYAGQFPSLQC
jgi:hypothetical protein